uniref:Uncharacterized protein n=1 Tax=Arundo donax TaxID=35708 RepID=A0A0A9EPU5_ARUDO
MHSLVGVDSSIGILSLSLTSSVTGLQEIGAVLGTFSVSSL